MTRRPTNSEVDRVYRVADLVADLAAGRATHRTDSEPSGQPPAASPDTTTDAALPRHAAIDATDPAPRSVGNAAQHDAAPFGPSLRSTLDAAPIGSAKGFYNAKSCALIASVGR